MFSRTFLAAFIAALPAVNAIGSAIVKNYCDTDVNLWSVSSAFGDGDRRTIAPGETYSEQYKSLQSGGVSIKMTHQPSLWMFPKKASITQFEYTLAGNIWYDISNIDGNPFWKKGMEIIPSDNSCPTKTCPAFVEQCHDAYNIPTDNHATAACSADSDITFVLCSANAPSRRDAGPVNNTVESRDAAPEPETTVEDVHNDMRKRAAHRHHFHRRNADSA